MVTAHDQAQSQATPAFPVTMRGYDRAQVDEYVAQLRTELRLFRADRDAALSQAADLASQLSEARSKLDELTNLLEQAKAAPVASVRPETPDQGQRRLRMAETRASEIINEAEAAAESSWAKAEQAATQLRQRYQHFLSELDKHQAEITAEYRALLGKAKVASMQLTQDADARRRELDAAAETRRKKIEDAFERQVAEKQAALHDKLAEQEAASTARVTQQTTAMIEKANQVVQEHQQRANNLSGYHAQLADRLRSAEGLLSQAEPFLDPLEDESR